jgi:hypothetical protein
MGHQEKRLRRVRIEPTFDHSSSVDRIDIRARIYGWPAGPEMETLDYILWVMKDEMGLP